LERPSLKPEHLLEQLVSLLLGFHKALYAVVLNKQDVVLQLLIALEGIEPFARFPVLLPLLAAAAIFAVPAELDTLLLYGARKESAGGAHPAFAFTSFAPAFGVRVVVGTKIAG